MTIRENVPLAALTTLKVGGVARYVVSCEDERDLTEALAFARDRSLPWRVLGAGSNVLAADEGFEGVVVVFGTENITMREEEGSVFLTADAGASWDKLVSYAAEHALWGLENLAGIPGTVGAAPVQNIGAYGSEVKDTIESVRVFDAVSGEVRILPNAECAFAYRDSRFKRDASLVILSVSLTLQKDGAPRLGYKDLLVRADAGEDLSTPLAIGSVVRDIRSRKFPDLSVFGTAGSFFKNPTISEEAYGTLKERYPDLPGFPSEKGIKVPLAFVLDRVLDLRGYREGNVSLFENQPIVLVADEGATAKEIDSFADDIARRVHDATGIEVEREVRNFSA